jgi:hypothetical protein
MEWDIRRGGITRLQRRRFVAGFTVLRRGAMPGHLPVDFFANHTAASAAERATRPADAGTSRTLRYSLGAVKLPVVAVLRRERRLIGGMGLAMNGSFQARCNV